MARAQTEPFDGVAPFDDDRTRALAIAYARHKKFHKPISAALAELKAELKAVEEHRAKALALVAHLAQIGWNSVASTYRVAMSQVAYNRGRSSTQPFPVDELIDLAIIVHICGSLEAQGFNDIYRAMRLKGASESRAGLERRLQRMCHERVLDVIGRRGRGRKAVWVLSECYEERLKELTRLP